MKDLYVKNQKELDNLPASFSEHTRIIIKDTTGRVIVSRAWENSSVEAWENSSVEAWGNSSVVAWENSSVEAWENSSVEAWENSSVEAWENSSVEARENSSVEAWENSSVEAWENSSVEAWENSSVEAWENSSVEAWGNSSVVAWENSSVEAWENSSVEAWENSSVVAWENSSVEAWGNVGVHLFSPSATVSLFMFAVCWQIAKGKIEKKSKTCTVIVPKPGDWFDTNGIEKAKAVVVFKRVSREFKTQEETKNETVWAVGSTVDHPAWNPKDRECGDGKFHACSRPYFCDEFRNMKGDRYIAIEVARKDTCAWERPSYPHKIAFKRGTVLYECDKLGRKV